MKCLPCGFLSVSATDGSLVAVEEEERFLRVKHWAGFPGESIRYCLREASLSIAEVEHVAIDQDSGKKFLSQD